MRFTLKEQRKMHEMELSILMGRVRKLEKWISEYDSGKKPEHIEHVDENFNDYRED